MNRYTIEDYPMFVEYGMFSEITKEDILNNTIKVLVDLETAKSITLSLYCGRKQNTINKKILDDVGYLVREWWDSFSYEERKEEYIKITKKQSGDNLIGIIKRQVDEILPKIDNGLDIVLMFHNRVKEYIK